MKAADVPASEFALGRHLHEKPPRFVRTYISLRCLFMPRTFRLVEQVQNVEGVAIEAAADDDRDLAFRRLRRASRSRSPHPPGAGEAMSVDTLAGRRHGLPEQRPGRLVARPR
jgi:hypothetical protein